MNPQDYDYIRALVKQRSGLVLSADKQYLVESRLLPVVRKQGLGSLADLVRALKTHACSPLETIVVEAMTTNESFFFRDKLPFEHFSKLIVPALLKTRSRERRIRIWCTAAATGQEPFSLAMALLDMKAAVAGWQIEILATDISTDALNKAKAGLYSQFEVQRGLPIQKLVAHFAQLGDVWQISPDIRNMVTFRPFNLLNDFTALGVFDVIFCRNVLIYFDQPTKTDVLERLCRALAPDGYLLLGAAETVVGLTPLFRPMPDQRGIYVPSPVPASASARVLRLATGA
jgi:chemotaxis protein methyltransferase CheR